ncbi:MAG: bi-domain-containing oxidoreductase [Candidatus Eiseniibacteriota bacterium]
MKQILQNYKTGELRLADVPAPALRAGGVLVATRASLISAGTEKMKVDVAKKSLLGKALERPDQVRKVVESVRQQGLLQTYEKVMNKLDTPTPLGYSSAGVVLEVGSDAGEFQVGDPVACAGAGYAVHAEIAYVPKNLVVPMRADTPFERGAFTTLGAIALQGVRQGEIRLGEDVVVIGLGLVGLLTVQLLKEAGARVVGIELDPARAALAKDLGCDRVVIGSGSEAREAVLHASAGRGADCAIVTAASSSSGPVALAGELLRDRGRVVVVGITKMDLPHRVFYEKELSLVLSRSYGPGRYDPSYEEQGVDYPPGYVRFTERRNMEEFLRRVEDGRVQVDPLISHRVPFVDAERAYALIQGRATEPYLGIVLSYGETPDRARRVNLASPGAGAAVAPARARVAGEAVGVGFVGAGNFATSMLLPHLKRRSDVRLTGVVTASGLTARGAAEKFGFSFCASEAQEVIADPATDAVFVVTRHQLHAGFAERALRAGKAVFVEKPLAVNAEELDRVAAAVRDVEASTGRPAPLLIGFNRRFAALSRDLAAHFPAGEGPLLVSYRVNAGFLGRESWYQDPTVGGGRILGEVCHFLDYVVFLTGSPIARVVASGMRDPRGHWRADDNLSVTAECADGSVGSVLYAAAGDPAMPKERVEVLGRGRSAVLDNYQSLTLWSGSKKRTKGALSVEKGHAEEIARFVAALVAGGAPPIAWSELLNVSRATLATIESLTTGFPVSVGPDSARGDAAR